jgi:DNA topoisomerase-1
VGNAEYARLNRSFGLATLRDRHAQVSGDTIRFRFRGKGGRPEERALVDAALARTIRRCQDLPGQLLFQYVDADGNAHGISSEDVNDYLREAAGTDEFSAKDFRTWAATILAYRTLRAVPVAVSGAHLGPSLRAAIEHTAEAIGDTPTVTRNSYIHPAVIAAFGEAGGIAGPGAAPRRSPGEAPPTRRDELEVLRFLRSRNGRATG